MRPLFAIPLLVSIALPAGAQAPATGPLVLLVPASTRATALGNAWVTGRDEDAQFYNPAQLLAGRPGFNLTLARYSSASTFGSMAGTYAAGPLSMTLGWGVQYLAFETQQGDAYPFSSASLTRDVSGEQATSMLGSVAAAIVWKGFRIGAAGKYVAERVPLITDVAGTIQTRHDAFLGDIGIARNFLSGLAGLSIQNLGKEHTGDILRGDIPRQALIGWSMARPAGEFDLGIATQVTVREDWVAPGGGIELGYGWIEGYSVAARVGARRTETSDERPLALGASFNADHLSIEYALQFFDGGRTANRMTLRWR